MNRVTITIHVDLPDGAVPDVAYGEVVPVVEQALRAFEAAPHPAESFPPFAAGQSWPPGECPVHLKPFKDGAYGPFCSGRGGNGPVNAKNYCDLKPGMLFQGKAIVAAEGHGQHV